MARAKIAVVVIAILALLQVSRAAARKHGVHGDGGGGTAAVMTVNNFEGGGGAAECDGKYHSNNDLIAALSTRWYAGGKRCHNKIRITSVQNGRTVEATVVDECDSRRGCKNNIVDTSKAVWEKLGLNPDIGEVQVTWSDV